MRPTPRTCEPTMLSKKIRNFLVFGCIAALFAAVGYWNISPERFLDKPVDKEDRPIGAFNLSDLLRAGVM